MTITANESRPYLWSELTEEEQHEATSRGFERGENIRYIVKKSYKDGELALVRWERVKPEPTHYLITKNKEAIGIVALSVDDAYYVASNMGIAEIVVRVDVAMSKEEWERGTAPKRITKSRDPVLSALRAEYLAALDVAPNASLEQWDAAIDRVNKARVAVNKREELYTPKRERKARRKKNEQLYLFRYVDAGRYSHAPLSTMYFAREMKNARFYIGELTCGPVGPGLRKEFIDEAKLCLSWARNHRIQAAALGRRLL